MLRAFLFERNILLTSDTTFFKYKPNVINLTRFQPWYLIGVGVGIGIGIEKDRYHRPFDTDADPGIAVTA